MEEFVWFRFIFVLLFILVFLGVVEGEMYRGCLEGVFCDIAERGGEGGIVYFKVVFYGEKF